MYATGGLAVTDLHVANAFVTTNNPANTAAGASSNSQTRAGWTVGGGGEWALWQNWSVKAEYLFVDFPSLSTSANVSDPLDPSPDIFVTSANLKAHIARVGINFKFDWGKGKGPAPVVARY